LAKAISSGSVFTPSHDAAVMNIAAPPRLPTTVKSRGTWIGRLSASPGTATKAETAGMPSV
jgi:hypothetical protein